jgi:hypothetical protein
VPVIFSPSKAKVICPGVWRELGVRRGWGKDEVAPSFSLDQDEEMLMSLLKKLLPTRLLSE